MKRIFCISLGLLFASLPVFSLEEIGLSGGVEFGNIIGHDDGARYAIAPGAVFSGYAFWEGKNIGAFINGSFSFPVIQLTGESRDDAPDLQWGVLFGPAFRLRFSEKLGMNIGVGLDITTSHAKYSANGADFFGTVVNFGVGGDIGVKYDITDTFFVKAGTGLSFDFLDVSSVHQKSTDMWLVNDDQNGSWLFNVKPYIAFGINFYSPQKHIYEKPVAGKPARENADGGAE
jgi:hypothetical protein